MKKIKKNQVIITALAIMIAAAGYINYTGNLSEIISVKDSATYNKEKAVNTSGTVFENEEDASLYEAANGGSSDERSLEEPGSAVLTSAGGITSGIISEAKLNREQIRAKNKETLMDIVNNAALTENAKKDAVYQLSNLTNNSEKEIAAELLLEAKGFSDIVVSLVDGNADVVVNKTMLTDVEKAQIEDIVKRKTGVNADKITINVCNNPNN